MSKRARVGVGVVNVGLAALFAIGVFRLLPTRFWLVDSAAAIASALLVASGVALLADAAIAPRLTRAAAGLVLALGLALFAALVLSASFLSGIYGPIGAGGAAIFTLVAALVLPYAVVLPAAELLWLGARANPERE